MAKTKVVQISKDCEINFCSFDGGQKYLTIGDYSSAQHARIMQLEGKIESLVEAWENSSVGSEIQRTRVCRLTGIEVTCE